MKQILLAILILAASQVNAQKAVKKSTIIKTTYLTLNAPENPIQYKHTSRESGKKYTKKEFDKISFDTTGLIGFNFDDRHIMGDFFAINFVDSITITNTTPYKKHGITTRTIYKKPE